MAMTTNDLPAFSAGKRSFNDGLQFPAAPSVDAANYFLNGAGEWVEITGGVPSLDEVLLIGADTGGTPITGDSIVLVENATGNSIGLNDTSIQMAVVGKGGLFINADDSVLSRSNAGYIQIDDLDNCIIKNVDDALKVGINTDNPTVALDVVGDVIITNDTAENFTAEKGDVNISAVHDDTTFDDCQVHCYSGALQTFVNMYASIDQQSGGYAELLLSANVATGKSFISMIADAIKISNLQNFATNAAAITGGLVAGDLYYTNVAGQATLKIVI